MLFSKSLLPSSILIGYPFTSASANLNPGVLSRSSTLNVMSFSFKFCFNSSSFSETSPIGIIIDLNGAILGGNGHLRES